MQTFQCAQLLGQPPFQIEVLHLETARTALRAAQDAGSALMVIHPEGHITVDPDYKASSLDALQTAVDGYIEPVTITRPQVSRSGPYVAYVNEEGLIHGQAFNPLAEQLFGVQIVGPLAVEVGFCIDAAGNTVPAPLQPAQSA
ncbi:hypothetical protein Deipr_2399 (plasmid) [Deinococcus proteolyticus MRP]|uniref:DUF3846 domain-containing protein n=1 Tax=Deinococcus proteolyticus (strain ATCC 35074 / DSM 20540 / JCM 6276 / NBRC 101906 / NCIMB 13154 / VKM Ac-1939 / CCM 2703 / MRP) TaxID=693977 RepID=F0RQG4_DEIPM|nr:DUF3846 domain-containing protein [Deinococcus proteolyticus]ADY27523.1 hypothetical protein Deipr_2399 [Deinococcus proteolyticus MRP]